MAPWPLAWRSLRALFHPQARDPLGHLDLLATARDEEGPAALTNGVTVDDALDDVAARRDLVHDVEERVLEHRAEPAGTGLVPDRFLGRHFERVLGEDQLDAV